MGTIVVVNRRKIAFLLMSFLLIWNILLISGCGTPPTSADSTSQVTLGAVSANSMGNEEKVEETKTQPAERPNPVAYMYTVSSSEGFAIIDSATPKCTACHRISNKGNSNGPGPNLNGLKNRAGSRVAGLSDREYVKQSILNPGAHIVDECPKGKCVDVMYKNYADKINGEDVEKLVNFLLTLDEEPRYDSFGEAEAHDNAAHDNAAHDNAEYDDEEYDDEEYNDEEYDDD